jgi:thiamine pyrophosphate-dependent acetolactate synthase large subunit-like protein
LIVVGRGGLGERAIYERLAERIGALLGTTFLAKGLFAGSPLDVGVVGGFSDFSVRPVLRQVDCVLAFGASMNGFTRGHGTATPNARIAQFDIDPAAFGRYGPTDVAVTGDALMCAQLLLEGASAPDERRLHKPEILRAVADRDVFGPVDESNAEGIDPRVLTVALDRLLPADRLVITDGGHHLGFGATAMRVSEPGRARLTTDFAAVGMGLGTACGAAIGRPELATILFIGDGGLAMTLGDLETAVRFQLPLVAVVMNDRAYGAERHFLDLEGLPHHHSQFNDIDFAAVAGGLGMEAVTIRSTADVQACAPRLTQPETPLLLDCKINGAVRAQWLVDLDAARRSAEERSMSPA